MPFQLENGMKRALPYWVQKQIWRQQETLRRRQFGAHYVRLDASFGVSLPSCWSGFDLIAPCSGCTSKMTCAGQMKCRSRMLDRQLFKGRKAPQVWAREKMKYSRAEAASGLGEEIERWAMTDPLLEIHAERRFGAMVYAAAALREVAADRTAFGSWFPAYDLRWSPFLNGLFADGRPLFFWIDRLFRLRLTPFEPNPSELHPRAAITTHFRDMHQDSAGQIWQPRAFLLWDMLKAFRPEGSDERLPIEPHQSGGTDRFAG